MRKTIFEFDRCCSYNLAISIMYPIRALRFIIFISVLYLYFISSASVICFVLFRFHSFGIVVCFWNCVYGLWVTITSTLKQCLVAVTTQFVCQHMKFIVACQWMNKLLCTRAPSNERQIHTHTHKICSTLQLVWMVELCKILKMEYSSIL